MKVMGSLVVPPSKMQEKTNKGFSREFVKHCGSETKMASITYSISIYVYTSY